MLQPGRSPISTPTSTVQRPKITLRSPELREVARRLAALGHRRVLQGHPLNVRRREKLRRTLVEAGDSLGWATLDATGRDPLTTVRADVRKMLRSGTKSLTRTVESELEAKAEEAERIETVVEQLHDLAEADEEAFPAELTFERTAKSGATKFKITTETVAVAAPEEAAQAARKIEKSMPRWGRIRDAAVEDLKARQETLGLVGKNLPDVLDGWRGLMKEVLIVMH